MELFRVRSVPFSWNGFGKNLSGWRCRASRRWKLSRGVSGAKRACWVRQVCPFWPASRAIVISSFVWKPTNDSQRTSTVASSMLIGIDWGGTKIEGVALTEKGEEIIRLREKTPRHDYEGCL